MNFNMKNIQKQLSEGCEIIYDTLLIYMSNLSHFYNDSDVSTKCKNVLNLLSPYVSSLFEHLFHLLMILIILVIVLINKITTIVFHQWTNYMKLTGRKRVILDRDSNEPYMERYYLLLKDRNDKFPFNIFLHKIIKSDKDELHDHPWGYFTFILSGGYYEHMKLKEAVTNEDKIIKLWRGPGFYQCVSSTHQHRLELDPAKGDTWTLFIPFKKEKSWGFFTKNGFVNNEEYLENKKNN